MLKIGDKVTRMLCGTIPMDLKVTDITEDKIICGAWEFDKTTGVEIDDMIETQVSHLVMDWEKESNV